VKVDFYMPQTKHGATSDNRNLVIKEVGETTVFPYDRPESKEIAGEFFEAVSRYNTLVATKVKGTYDVIHCHDWLTIQASIALKDLLGVPLILTVHSTEYDRSGWLHPNQWFIDIEREGMEKADKIIAVSQFTKRTIIEKYGMNPDKITVIYNALYIARIIADTIQKPLHKIEEDMNNRTTLNATEAKDYGLVHEIKSELFPIDADLSVIGESIGQTQPHPVQMTMPHVQAFTKSKDLYYGTL